MRHFRATSVSIILMALVGACPGQALAADLPDELQYLDTLKQDPAALVDAARRFHLQQSALIEWDQKLVEEHQRDQQPNLAQTQRDTMQRRAKLVRTVWEWVLDQYPNDPRANNYFGEYLADVVGDEAGGLQHWMTAVQFDAELGAAHNNLGIYYFHGGDYARGLDHLQRALKADPDNPDYLYNMAQMYLVHFVQIERITKTPRDKIYKQAMEMSSEAAELAPHDFHIVQDYAVNFFAAENFGVEADWKTAAAAWQAAQAVARTEDERFYTLLNEARARLSAGDAQGAVPALESAIALKKDSAVAEQLLAKARQAL